MKIKHLVVLSAYTLVALVMSWPLALNLSTAIPGVGGDASSYVWALGWAKTALADLGVDPFRTDYVFYPLGGATQLLWAVSLVGLVSIPLQFLFDLVTAHNVLYLAATVLTAFGTFLLAEYVVEESLAEAKHKAEFDPRTLPPFATFLVVQYVLQNRKLAARHSSLAPFTAGLVFAFAPLRLGYGLAFLNLYNTEFIPFYLLFLLRATRRSSLRDGLVAGLLLGLNAYVDFQIAAFLVLLTTLYGMYLLFVWLRERRVSEIHLLAETRFLREIGFLGRSFSMAQLRTWGVLALTALLVALPMLGLIARDFAIEGENYIRVYKLDYSAERSYDLMSFFLPHARSALYADAPVQVAGVNSAVKVEDESARSPDRQAFVGYVVLALAAFAAVKRWRIARLWFFAAALFALFSLGPSLHILGRDAGVPLPFVVLHEIPIVNHIRIPMRYGIIVYVALAMLAAITLHALAQRTNRLGILPRLLVWLVPIAILAEYAILPYPVQALTIPRVYEEIAREPVDGAVLEIPSFYWRYAAANEVYQAVHQKRLLRGYTNRIAPGLAEYGGLRGTPIVVRSLRALEGIEKGGLSPEDIAEDKRVRDEVIRFFGLRYAVLHRDQLEPDQVQSIDHYLRDVLDARAVYADGEVTGYALPDPGPVPGRVAIDLRENIGQMYAGRGWQFEYPPANYDGRFNFVWARGARSEVYFVSPLQSDRRVTLHAYAAPPQRASVRLNGEPVGELELTSEWQDHSVVLPARAVRAGMNRVELYYAGDSRETVGVTTITIDEVAHGRETNR